MKLRDGARIAVESRGDAPSGSIEIRSVGNLQLSNAARVSALSTGEANAGDIGIQAQRVLVHGGSSITTDAGLADGGNIDVAAPDYVDLLDSEITATVSGDFETTGGNIRIRTDSLVVDPSRIVARAFEGTGGFIQINASGFFVDEGSEISAASELGVDGVVEVSSPEVDLSAELSPLSEEFIDVSDLLVSACAARTAPGRQPRRPRPRLGARRTGLGPRQLLPGWTLRRAALLVCRRTAGTQTGLTPGSRPICVRSRITRSRMSHSVPPDTLQEASAAWTAGCSVSLGSSSERSCARSASFTTPPPVRSPHWHMSPIPSGVVPFGSNSEKTLPTSAWSALARNGQLSKPSCLPSLSKSSGGW